MKRALGLALLLAACGGGGASTIVDPPAQGQSSPPAAPPAIRQEMLPVSGNFTPAFDAEAARTCATTVDRIMDLSAGRFEFQTRPQPLPCALMIIGQGRGGTTLVRAHGGGGAFLEWVRGRDNSGGGISDLTIVAANGTFGGAAIKVTATADTDGTVNSFNRHSFEIESIQIGRDTANASWDIGIHFDGTQNPDGNPNSVPGVRAPYISRTSASGTNFATILLDTVRGGDFNVECYIPLNGSKAEIVAQNITDSIRIESRNCQARRDATSVNVTLNGVPQ